MVNIMFTIVGEREALVRSLQIANKELENKDIEIAQLRNELHNTKDKLLAMRVKYESKPKLNVVKVYQFPELKPG